MECESDESCLVEKQGADLEPELPGRMDVNSGGAPASDIGRYLLVRGDRALDWDGLGQVGFRSIPDKELHWKSLESRQAPSRVCLGKKSRIAG